MTLYHRLEAHPGRYRAIGSDHEHLGYADTLVSAFHIILDRSDDGYVYDTRNSCVVLVVGNGKSAEDRLREKANPRLIAAASDLLEALREMVRMCNLCPDAPYHRQARAAIVKATGVKA